MLKQIKGAIRDPNAAWHMLKAQRHKLPWGDRQFVHAEEFRSDSEKGDYVTSIAGILGTQRSFENFKRDAVYRRILEHVSEREGAQYLEILQSRNDGVLDTAIDTVLRLDSVGNPVKYRYPGFDTDLSPTTLRYVKVASDLFGLFGRDHARIAEIGCGYGGQTLTNDKLLGFQHATLFDLPVVNQLIKRYLGSVILDGAFKATTLNEELPQAYDLAISNYAFSELPAILQRAYIAKVLSCAERGYLTMNSGIGGERDLGKLSLDDLRALLPPFTLVEEQPLTSKTNYIILWGHDVEFCREAFREKSL